MRTHVLCVRRASSACGEPALHAEAVCWRAETHLRIRRYFLGVWRAWEAPHTLWRHSPCPQVDQCQRKQHPGLRRRTSSSSSSYLNSSGVSGEGVLEPRTMPLSLVLELRLEHQAQTRRHSTSSANMPTLKFI